jgi:hypothetical protein
MDGLRETNKRERFDGVNWRYKMESCPKAEALVWKSDARLEEIAKAEEFADKEGYSVISFPTTEVDPIGKAKQLVMATPYPLFLSLASEARLESPLVT